MRLSVALRPATVNGSRLRYRGALIFAGHENTIVEV